MNKISVQLLQDFHKKDYCFLCYDEVSIGDLVVVDTVNGFLLGRVTDLEGSLPDSKVLKEVVAVVNEEPYKTRQAIAERKKELKKKMDARVKKLQAEAIYRLLAKEDHELADLLTEYEAI